MLRVPNAKEGRESVDYEIYGVNGIPEEAFAERAAKKARVAEANTDEVTPVTKQETHPDVLAPGQPAGVPGQPVLPQFHPQMPGMYGQPMPGMPFHPIGQPGFAGMMGGPRPGFNPMQNGVPQMQHGAQRMPPHMFGGPPGSNGQFQGMYGAPGGPMPGYPRGVPPGPPRNLPPGHDPPPAPPARVEVPPNGAAQGGSPPGVPLAPVPPLFPAGAAPPSSELTVVYQTFETCSVNQTLNLVPRLPLKHVRVVTVECVAQDDFCVRPVHTDTAAV